MDSQLMSLPRLMLLGSVLLSVLQLGCSNGGGGGGGVPTITAPEAPPAEPDTPSLSLTPTAVKRFNFSWTDVDGETEYRLLENPDGASGYRQVASIAADATSHDLEVFLPGRINASYILQACNSGGCSDSSALFVSGTLAGAIGYFKASNAEASDLFSRSVALSADGNTLAVGAYLEDSAATGVGGDQNDNTASDSGAVYLFSRSDNGWFQQAYLKASNTGAGDYFGRHLALSADGDTLAVGAHLEDSGATGIGGNQSDDTATDSGAVYIFTRNDAGVWSQQAYVKATNTEAYDRFGVDVALSGDGNTLAVGADAEDSAATGIDGDQGDNTASVSGAAYVFTRTSGMWTQQSYVKASNTEAHDWFGTSVALSDDGYTLAVVAYAENSAATGIDGDQSDNTATDSGAVYLFNRADPGGWSQQAYIKASNTEATDSFGIDVALSGNGNTLAVGAHGEDSGATGIDGDQSNNAASVSGATYVYTRTSGTWSQQAYVKASNTEANDRFGWALALSDDGNTLAVGADAENSAATGIDGDQSNNTATASGAVYLFTRGDAGGWSQQAYVKASNTGGSDRLGDSVALSGDGKTLAVGAQSEDSAATGLGGDQSNNDAVSSGAVYLY